MIAARVQPHVSLRTTGNIMRKFLVAATIATAFGSFSPVSSQNLSQDEVDQKLGKVHFATTCNEVAQRRFDRAMRYQHSFWYAESKNVYEEAIKADPDCAIAYWGIALSLLGNPHGAIPAPNLPPGLAAIEKGKIHRHAWCLFRKPLADDIL